MTLANRLRNVNVLVDAQHRPHWLQQQCDDAADEIERLREIIVQANNAWRHEFAVAVESATDDLFKKLSAQNTDPFNRATPTPADKPAASEEPSS